MRVEVTIFAARGLPKLDQWKHQTPYCVVQIGGMQEELRTNKVKSSRNPEWNETFSLSGVPSEEMDVTLTVLHKDIAISSVSFNLSGVEAGENIDQWVALQAEDGSENGGEIHVSFAFLNEESESRSNVEEQKEPETAPETPKSKTPGKKEETSEEMERRQQLEEIKQKAAEQAQQKYAAFLRDTTPTLIDNERRMAKYRADMEESESGGVNDSPTRSD